MLFFNLMLPNMIQTVVLMDFNSLKIFNRHFPSNTWDTPAEVDMVKQFSKNQFLLIDDRAKNFWYCHIHKAEHSCLHAFCTF